ncbi:MAG: hypothetical protein GF383_04555 [Candidatus Lokiarchaeota archaeon]|nr:hypothetical protein [Candidatus Lokiarchaeota archaeon]MBD3339056.1 hypothetical protein [Candidatus Lokiarchaeota archaeon]
MPHVERSLEIEAPVKKVFNTIDDTMLATRWNLVVKELKEIEAGKYAVKTTLGDLVSTRAETVPNKKISLSVEGGAFRNYGYILKKKGDSTEVTLWAEFEDESQEKMLLKAGMLLLQSLKNYVEFIESGGNPEEFDKKKMIATH